MTKKKIINLSEQFLEPALHILGWVLVFGSPFLFMDNSTSHSSWNELRQMFLVPGFIAFVFYMNYFILAPRYLQRGKTGMYLLLAGVLIIVCFLIIQGAFDLMRPNEEDLVDNGVHRPRPVAPRWMFFVRDLVMLTLSTTVGAITQQSRLFRKAEMERQQAEMERQQAELRNLHNQINPHFLLNTLNNIYALISINADKAQAAVQQLSVLLRHLLYENKEMFVSLTSEVQFIRNYIELMRIRLGGHVTLAVDIREDEFGLKIAPLIFISLIENAFKHGVSSGKDCAIHIGIRSEASGRVVCEIENSNHPKNTNDKSGHGIGLQQVQRRLDLLYPGKYSWVKGTEQNDTVYRSVLTIETK